MFVDINMPDMDGQETTRRAKSLLAGKTGLKAWFIATTAQEEDTVQERELFDGYLKKPIGLPELKGILHTFEGRN